MKKKVWIWLAVLALVATLVLAACRPDEPFVNPGDQLGGGGTGDVADAADTTAIEATKRAIVNKSVFTETELETSEAGATKVAAISGVVEISKEGTYLFEGSYGGIKVTKKDLQLHFIFKNASFKNESGIAIDCQDKKVASLIITLADGTNNYVTNSGDDVNAIHVRGALVINGKGSLTVKSGSKNALKCSKEIKIVDATLSLEAVSHAIACSALIAKNCTVKVTAAGKDGINAEYDGYDPEQSTFTDSGFVSLIGVNYTCSVDGDGIQANTVVYVNGGTYNITTNGNFVPKSADNMTAYGMTAEDFNYTKSGGTYKRVANDETGRYGSNLFGLTQSCKGIKVGEIETATDGNYLIAIDGGTFNINSTDDAIHASSGNVIINGGTHTISTLDDAITSAVLSKITGGNVNVTSCYEGIEGEFVEISGGTVNVVSTDDGINAASDSRKQNTSHVIISGGDVTVNASGDGIDSNGSILISGGNVVVHGPTTGGDAGLDSDRGIVVTGGTLFVTSTLGMVETPSTNSTQCVVSYAQNSAITVGTKISLRDDSGNVLIEVEVKKNNCQSIILSHPSLKNGSKYSIYSGNTKLETFTVSSIITSIGVSTSNRGPGGFGGGRR